MQTPKFDAAYQQAMAAYNNAANMPVKVSAGEEPEGSGFAGLVSEAFNTSASALRQGEQMTAKALVKEADITDVVTSVSEAEVALQTFITVRDRVISAYQDIIKMPI